MKKIVLVGFMGAGKTTLGRLLAQRLNIAFVDTDDLIVKEENRPVNDIFAKDGEAYFRNLETKQLEKLIRDNRSMVISVGGGLPIQPQNHELLKKLGCVIYLKAGKETLVKRLSRDTRRPLLRGGSVEEKVEKLMKEREHVYERVADRIVYTDGKSVGEAVSLLKKECAKIQLM